ncbi:MAG: hypothetical protein ACLPJY_00425, partial [Rhodomicrobium sp.]
LAEVKKLNANVDKSLDSHLIPGGLIEGRFDNSYQTFLEARGALVIQAFQNKVVAEKDDLIRGIQAQ